MLLHSVKQILLLPRALKVGRRFTYLKLLIIGLYLVNEELLLVDIVCHCKWGVVLKLHDVLLLLGVFVVVVLVLGERRLLSHFFLLAEEQDRLRQLLLLVYFVRCL